LTVLYVTDEELGRWLIQEDHPVQWFQVFLLFASAVFAWRTARILPRESEEPFVRRFFFVLMAGCLLVLMEEISWGQRIFGLATPEFLEHINRQHEISLHNIGFLQRFRHVPLILFGTTGAGLILFRKRILQRLPIPSLHYLLPPPEALVPLLITLLIGLVVEAGYDLQGFSTEAWEATLHRIRKFAEVGELMVYFIILGYSVVAHEQVNRNRAAVLNNAR